MKMLSPIKTFIDNLDEREFMLSLVGLLSFSLLVTGSIVYSHYHTTRQLKKKIMRLNNNRSEVQQLLTRFEQVKQQKIKVSDLLAKDPTFRIVGYIDTVLTSLQLSQNKSGLTPSEQALDNLPEYSEVKVDVHLTNINMQQLVTFLNEIEKSERVYTKNIDIAKPEKSNIIDVHLIVGTLQAKATE